MKKIWSALALFIIFVSSAVLVAQQPYKLPPKEVIDIVDAPPLPRAMLSPRKDLMLLAEYEPMPSIAYLAQPILRIAGIRITPNITSRLQTTFYTGLVLKSIKDGREQRVELPPGIKFGSPQWSYNGRWVAFSRYLDTGIELWVVDALTGKARDMELPALNAVLTNGYSWLPDNLSLLVFAIPEGRGNPPTPPRVPVGPNVQETAGKFAKVWTYQDLLKTPFDETLFEYYATTQIVKVDVITGQTQKLGTPGIYSSTEYSPDGTFILVYRIKKPYSYSVPYPDFAHSVEVWDSFGKLVRTIADLPAAEEVPLNGVPTGPRDFEWQPLKSGSLLWVEALDGGDPEKDVPNRDKIMTLSAPFEGQPNEVVKIRHRYSGVTWLGQKGLAFVTEFDWKKKWETTYLINTELPEVAPKKIFDLSAQDEYNAPGYPVLETTLRGERVAVQDREWIFLSGPGSSPQGDRPFLDRLSTRTLEKTRLHQSGETSYETFVAFLNPTRDSILTSFESKTEPPNYYLVNLKTKKRKPLTAFKDPAPQLTTLKKELIKYKREDGVELSGTLYLPPGYREGERLPVLVWAYPLEYNDPGTAGQVRGSPNRFTFFRGTSELFFLTQGYAVLDNAQMPVVGDPKTMNDTFVEQIVMNAKAAINALDTRGVGDPKRVGVGGHSYGAFMTANLLAHCDLFAAGIARSGAYNRTLTPFGFQSERRTLWQAPEIYFKLSPFMCADKVNEPILLIHGEADNNSGTFPIQSERLFQALKGFGATARLVMLPYESHGYAARESVLDVLAEMFEWFDKYVKNKK
jgi:dipeptidyl aminopeptidase/acylaminoacyl peptidase